LENIGGLGIALQLYGDHRIGLWFRLWFLLCCRDNTLRNMLNGADRSR